ncbi:MAG TPA: HNH endonuclease [Ktedonobacteraceae bacterium]|jgi:hypothetical protein|nr:HNH endonuclease [Ktedonobacteraceae bacterium]
MQTTDYQRVRAHVGIARRMGKQGTLTLAEWEQTVADFNGMCAYCLFRPYEVLEHFVPVMHEGTHVNNCVPACVNCNVKKRNRIDDDLVRVLGPETVERVRSYLLSRTAKPDEPQLRTSPSNQVIPYVPRPPIPRSAPYQWLTQVAIELKVNRATLCRWAKRLGIKTHEFFGDTRVFIKTADVKRIKRWLKKR